MWKKIKRVELTQSLLNEYGYTKCFMESPKKGSGLFYSKECDALSFEFDQKGECITFEACSYPLHWSNAKDRPNSRRIGSVSSAKSFVVPYSEPDIEAVFGKPDRIEQSSSNRGGFRQRPHNPTSSRTGLPPARCTPACRPDVHHANIPVAPTDCPWLRFQNTSRLRRTITGHRPGRTTFPTVPSDAALSPPYAATTDPTKV